MNIILAIMFSLVFLLSPLAVFMLLLLCCLLTIVSYGDFDDE